MLDLQNIPPTSQTQTDPQPKASDLFSSIAATFNAAGSFVQAQELQYESRINALQQAIPSNTNIVAEQKRKELVAVLNALYESGLVNKDIVSKAEFFKRQAAAFGDPQLANYATQLTQIMLSNKYEDVFDQVTNAGIGFRQKKDN